MPLNARRVAGLAFVNFFADDMPTYAAALAYRILFSLFPFLIFLTTLLAFLGIPEFFDWMRERAAYVLPGPAMEQVNTVLDELERPQGGLMSLAIALTVWSASTAVMGTMNALNVAYGVTERRPLWKRVPVSILYTLALAVMLITAAVMMATGPSLLTALAHYVGLDTLFMTVWTWLRWPLAACVMLLAVAIVYYAAPNLKQRFHLMTYGAVVAVSSWIMATLAFGYYVQHFASYSKSYGSVGAVIVLLFYFFLSAAALLLGAEVNAVIMRERGERVEEADRGPRNGDPE